jgi:hypothetical protein
MILCVLAIIISAITHLLSSSVVNADSVIATITIGTGPYGTIYNPLQVMCILEILLQVRYL